MSFACPTMADSHMFRTSGPWGDHGWVLGGVGMRRVRGLGVVVVLGVLASLGLPAGSAAAAAPGDVVISEFMFDPVTGVDGDEFLELTNRTASPVDMSGWSFTKGITLVFPAGTTIGANARMVISPDAARTQLTYGVTVGAVYTGSLSNGGEQLTLKDAAAITIDTLTYDDVDPWPTTTDGTGPSLELIDPAQDHNNPDNWAASTNPRGNTIGAANSVAGTGLKPHITAVAATPNVPTAGQAVTVTATVTGQTGTPTVVYRIGANGADTNLPMTSSGVDTYTADIPGSTAGQLIRYRVDATNAAGTNHSPRVDDSEHYKGVVVANTFTSAIPVLELFVADADFNEIVSRPTDDITGSAVLAYNGTVYDNVHIGIRGESTQTLPKKSWKIEMPRDHDIQISGAIEPVDEFAMNADFSDGSHGRPLLAWDSYAKAGVVNQEVFPVRAQRNAAFFGLYTYLDIFDGTWRDREDYSDKQFFKAGHGAFDATRPLVETRFEKKNPDDADFSGIAAFLDGVDLTSTAQANFLRANADIPEMINYAVATAVVQHVDSISKNFYLSQDPVAGRWRIIPWDLDHTFGNGCCGVNSTFVTPAEPTDNTSELMRAILAVPDWKTMYFRRLKTVVNQVLATGQLEALYDAKVGPASSVSTLDLALWPRQSGSATYAGLRTNLFNAIQSRRNVFANDARVPGNQPAAPNIVINEIQPALGGSSSDFVELYNPSTTTAIDLSGWTMTGGISLTIQPGAVILPGGTMTFVANDPAFRAIYGSSAFVGGVYTGDLPASATLTLARPDASVADTLTYGGAGWPDASTGRSMELTNPASDNSVGANWAQSVRPAGSPSAANGGGAVGSAPGAPTIGTATAGNMSATVRWTAPGSAGGSPIAGYTIQVLDALNAQVGGLQSASPSATSMVVTGLTKGVPVHFVVTAVNNAGAGPASGSSNTVTPPATTVPKLPNIGTATIGATGSPITATATWTPPTNTGGSAITAYVATALRMSSTAADATVLSRSVSPRLGPGIRSRQFTLVAGANYRFEVVAINVAGDSSPSNRSNNVVPR
jgi:hypothetical protein